MKLQKCEACGHNVSSQANACPNCGHPIAAAKKAKAGAAGGAGCAVVLLAIAAVIAYAIMEGSNIQKEEAAHPTCVSDYKKCSDNKELIERHESGDHFRLSIECKSAAEKMAKYGAPELPFFSFGSYYAGRSYIDNGTAILIEKNAKFKNGFGATENVTATCFYDLKANAARVTVSRD